MNATRLLSPSSLSRRPAAVVFAVATLAQLACSSAEDGNPVDPDSVSSALSEGGTPIVSAIGGKCLDDNGDGTANETKIQLYACNKTAAQEWSFTRGTFVGPGGKCLDIQSDRQVPGTVVQLYSCNGTTAQTWALSGSAIKSTGGLCLDARGGVNGNGTQVQIAACNGGASQQWTVTGESAPPDAGAKADAASKPDAASAPDAGAKPDAASGSGGSGATFWVYDDGVFNWGGDYSFAATPNYKDTAGAPEDGPFDIAVTVTGAWGGFQPYAGGTVPTWDFDDAAYTYLVMDLKPTVDNQSWNCLFHAVGDVQIGNGVDILDYGPKPTKGVWAHYKIPLKDLGVYDNGAPTYSGVYKFFIQDQTGLASNVFYVDKLGFTAE
jgi:hypothetical protein